MSGARSLALTALLALAFALCACAGMIPDKREGRAQRDGRDEGVSQSDNSHLPRGRAYTVRGQTYRPYTSAQGFTEVGVASWYGPGFHGKTTANGERYNQNDMTAAHKLLPFGTRIRVTNMENGRVCVVRINDRGPFVNSRIIDLSNKAARQIDMVGAGTARVRLEALDGGRAGGRGGGPLLTPEGDMLGSFYVQIGAFRLSSNARALLRAVTARGMAGRVYENRGSGLRYVQVGPFSSVDKAEAMLARLRPEYPDLFVVAE